MRLMSEPPDDPGAERRDANDPVIALRTNKHPDVRKSARPLAQRHVDAAANEHTAGVVGHRVAEYIIHVWPRDTARNPGKSVWPETAATEWCKPHFRGPEEECSTTEGRYHISIAARLTGDVRPLEAEHERDA